MLQGQVEKLNRQNTEHSQGKAVAGHQTDESGSGGRRQEQAALILDGPDTSTAIQLEEKKEATKEEGEEEEEEVVEDRDIFEDSESEDGKLADDGKKKGKEEEKEAPKSETSQSVVSDISKTSALPVERYFWQLIFIPLQCQESKPRRGKRRKERCVLIERALFWFFFEAPMRLEMWLPAANVASQRKTW